MLGQCWRIAHERRTGQWLEGHRPPAGSAMTEIELARIEVDGAELAVRIAGRRECPALLLIHGFPSSSETFRNVILPLARDCFVLAPDLPGFGGSAPIEQPSFSRFADIVEGLLARLGVTTFYLYLHDYGAAVGLHLATRAPRRIRGLIVQNANTHETGLGPQWSATRAYWDEPTPERQAEATAHLTLEGTRDQYVSGVPVDIAELISPTVWEEDWRIMTLPGRLETQRALVLDYRNHVARFGDIAEYLNEWQPPALMIWGRHDVFFDLAEIISWMTALPRMEAHVLDGPHFLLETHAAECAASMRAFVRRAEIARAGRTD
jgi:pimeloyl-ACP methyl ester carboxylesterase